MSSTTRQIGAVLGVAVLGAVVRARQSGGASFEAGLDSAFLVAGAVTSATAVFTGLWLTRPKPAESPPRRGVVASRHGCAGVWVGEGSANGQFRVKASVGRPGVRPPSMRRR